MKTLIRCAIALICSMPTAAFAQGPPEVPSSASEPQGIMAEPDIITRVVLFADRHLGKGDLTNGIYVDYGSMIPGAGWASVGPGYKHWYGKDSMFFDASASISVNSYRQAQARVELPTLLKSRLVLGGQARWQDFRDVAYFGVGDTPADLESSYAIESTQLSAYATLRPIRWLDLDAQIGWMNPHAEQVSGPLLGGVSDKREFVPTAVGITLDSRDYPGHPTKGLVMRGTAARFDDRTDGTHSFKRYDGEAAGFIPMGRAVLALHGWAVKSDLDAGRSVPFYLQPSLGGVSSLRSFMDYRFHDDNMLLATAELRLAMMTHLDLAFFGDAGNVARQFEDLNLDKRSYGVGLRLHTRRETFASVDVAHGTEGWHAILRLKDPLLLGRLSRKTTIVPFVP